MQTELPSREDFRRVPLDGFASTEWSMILAASRDGEQALNRLCRTYWRPVYVFVRASGVPRANAEDVTQEYFADMLRRDWLRLADPERGSFRAFLRVSVRHFLANRWRHDHAKKRFAETVPLDSEEGERELAALGSAEVDPAAAYEQSWADCVLQIARGRLAAGEARAGRALQFEHLSPFLSRSPSAGEYASLAKELAIPTGQVALLVHRLSRRFSDLVRAEVLSTLREPDDLEDELRYLLKVVSEKK